MADAEQPQIYLVTPPEPDLDSFPDVLGRVLDTVPVACVRLALAGRDAGLIGKAADILRETCHARDVPLVIDSHLKLVEPHGLDGVHLPDGARGVRAARKALGADAIVGAFCGASRHDGMNAGRGGGRLCLVRPAQRRGTGRRTLAEPELFAWWSEMIELPVVAEGGVTPEIATTLAPITDFLALGEEVWASDDPVATLKDFVARLG